MQSITELAPSQKIKVSAHQLQSLPVLSFVSGNPDTSSMGLCRSEKISAGSLVFTSNKADTQLAITSNASLIIALEKSIDSSFSLNENQALFSCKNIHEAMAAVLKFFDAKKDRIPQEISISTSISKSAKIGKNVKIGNFVTIGDGATIGDNTIISPQVVIENNVVIGRDCIVHPLVMIGSGCQIGHRCEIHSQTTIGSDGFAFYLDKDSTPTKIPQVGIVIIEDDVEIGANCSIDRATLTETRIGANTKLDNQIHIAHNVVIGKNCRITAGFIIAGSSEIGDNFLTGGSSSVTDHVKITKNVVLAGRSTVTKDIIEPGAYGGYPLEPLKHAMKTIANISNITSMRKQIHEVRKHLGLNSESENK